MGRHHCGAWAPVPSPAPATLAKLLQAAQPHLHIGQPQGPDFRGAQPAEQHQQHHRPVPEGPHIATNAATSSVSSASASAMAGAREDASGRRTLSFTRPQASGVSGSLYEDPSAGMHEDASARLREHPALLGCSILRRPSSPSGVGGHRGSRCRPQGGHRGHHRERPDFGTLHCGSAAERRLGARRVLPGGVRDGAQNRLLCAVSAVAASACIVGTACPRRHLVGDGISALRLVSAPERPRGRAQGFACAFSRVRGLR
jgi:hypothetical protein